MEIKQHSKKKAQGKFQKYFERIKTKHITQNFIIQDAVKAVLRRKLIDTSVYIKKRRS